MVDGKITVLKAGDIAYAPKNVPHAWKVVGTEKVKMITSAFPAGIEEMFYELASLPAGPPDLGKVTEICKMITSAFPGGIEEMFYELASLPAGPPDLGKVAEICGNYGVQFLKG